MTPDQIDEFFRLMENTTSNKRDSIRSIFLERLGDQIIEYCEKYYDKSAKADFRYDLLRFITRYARTSQKAKELAINALNDKSKKVRQSAIGVIAYSLDESLISFLQDKKNSLKGNETDIDNAINAIKKKNHNLYYPQYNIWHVTMDNVNRHLDVAKHNEEIEFYIHKHAPELVDAINDILNKKK